MEIAGDQANMLSGGIIKIAGLKMNFYEEGKKVMNVSTPLCFYDRVKRTAASTAEVRITRSEIVITGRGFDLDEKNTHIRINKDSRVILNKSESRARPDQAAFRSAPEHDTNNTSITSVRLTFDQKKATAVFEGNVVVTDPALKIESDRLTVSFSSDKKVEAIEAEGNVAITRDAIAANSQKAIYSVGNGKVTLSGNPSVTRGRNRLSAETIVYWRDSNRILCEPSARLTVYSEHELRNRAGRN